MGCTDPSIKERPDRREDSMAPLSTSDVDGQDRSLHEPEFFHSTSLSDDQRHRIMIMVLRTWPQRIDQDGYI